MAVLIPLVSALVASSEKERVARLYASSLRSLLLALAPAALLIAAFAPELLRVWVGPDYADRSATALRILALGVFVNALVHVPFGYLQAIGRPDITAKAHVAELVVHLPMTWILVMTFGLNGAAVAWSVRVIVDGVILFSAVSRIASLPISHVLAGRARVVALALSFLVFGLAGASLLDGSVAIRSAIVTATLGIYLYVVWRHVMDDEERGALLSVRHRLHGRANTTRPVARPPLLEDEQVLGVRGNARAAPVSFIQIDDSKSGIP
jgi:O-antigen/teichoic acid export membrane protein